MNAGGTSDDDGEPSGEFNAQRLWAPWRLGYIKGTEEPPAPTPPMAWQAGASESCFLCRAAAEFAKPADADRENLVAWRGEQSLVVLNRFPYSNGHLLVSPARHVADLAELSDEEHLEIMQQLSRLTQILRDKVQAQGFNLGLNLGALAGAGVPGHLHWHLVPRWPGDHNFMPVTAGVRVIPQSLEELWGLLQGALE